MRVTARELSNEERIRTLDALYTAANAVKGRENTKAFLRDLLTENERIMLGRRILIARALLMGLTFDKIVEDFGVGKDTIQRVSRWLHDQMPGYENAVREMESEFKRRKVTRDDKELYATSMLYRLKKKYPLHFLLFPTPKKK